MPTGRAGTGRTARTRRTPKVRGAARSPRAKGAARSPRASRARARARRIRVPADRHAVRATPGRADLLRREILQYVDSNGFLSWSAREKKYVILGTRTPKGGLVRCPACGLGELMIIRSKGTGKRFMGCSNYYGGCRASSPLLQRARLRGTKTACGSCGWPEVIFRYSRKQRWTRRCSNIACPGAAAQP